MKKIYLLIGLLFLQTITLAGPIDALEFNNPQYEKRYFNLIEELRCLKCQNSNIAGSNAELAKDLRKKVYKMIVSQHKSDDEIKQWMLDRYGDFVLYKPPVKKTTLILWGLPLLLGLAGFILLFLKLINRKKIATASLTSTQQQELDEILKK